MSAKGERATTAPERCPACGCRHMDYQPMLDGTLTAVCTKCGSEWSGYDYDD